MISRHGSCGGLTVAEMPSRESRTAVVDGSFSAHAAPFIGGDSWMAACRFHKNRNARSSCQQALPYTPPMYQGLPWINKLTIQTYLCPIRGWIDNGTKVNTMINVEKQIHLCRCDKKKRNIPEVVEITCQRIHKEEALHCLLSNATLCRQHSGIWVTFDLNSPILITK